MVLFKHIYCFIYYIVQFNFFLFVFWLGAGGAPPANMPLGG
jgi:hypothetical protein